MSEDVQQAAMNNSSTTKCAISSASYHEVSKASTSECYGKLDIEGLEYQTQTVLGNVLSVVVDDCLPKDQQSETCGGEVSQNLDHEVCRPPLPSFKARKSKPNSFEGSCSSTTSSSGFESTPSIACYTDEVFAGADGSSATCANKTVKSMSKDFSSPGCCTSSIDSNSVVDNQVDCSMRPTHDNRIPYVMGVHNINSPTSEMLQPISSSVPNEFSCDRNEIEVKLLRECEKYEKSSKHNAGVPEAVSKMPECVEFGGKAKHPANSEDMSELSEHVLSSRTTTPSSNAQATNIVQSPGLTRQEFSSGVIDQSHARKGDQANVFNFQSGDKTLEAAMSVMMSDLSIKFEETKAATSFNQIAVDMPDSSNDSVGIQRSTSTRRHAPVATLSEFDDDYDPLDTLDPDLFAPEWTSEMSLLTDNTIFKIPSVPVSGRVAPKLSVGMFGQVVDEDDTDGNVSEDGMSDGGEFLDDNVEFRRPSPDVLLKSIPIVASHQHLVTSKKGYLFKYSSQKSALGKLASVWQKRWVTVDQESLKYFSSRKSVISKRVIPISTLSDIQQEIKIGDTHAFRFLLKTFDRMYKFSAESSDELALWTSILMHSIMDLKGDSFQLCGNMNSPDKADFVRLEGKNKKQYLVLKSGQLCFYNTVSDFRAFCPIHCEELQLASIKDLGKLKLQLLFPQFSFTFLFDTQDEFNSWKTALKEGIMLAHGDDQVIELVYQNPSNRQCADCRAPAPEWAAINIGITLCQLCAGVHREMPSAKVRSLRMDDKVWKPALIQLMKAIGNDNANRFWEACIKDADRIDNHVDVDLRTKFIGRKYTEKEFCPHHLYPGVLSTLNNSLREAIQQSNLLLVMSLVFMGANVSRDFLEENNTATLPVTSPESAVVMEFLKQNSSERSMSLSKLPSPGPLTPKSAMWECLKHNREVTHCGYLYKLTSSTSKGSIPKLWYILQNGIFTYLANEKSGEVKESIDQRSMTSVSVADDERVKHVFELATTVNNSEHQSFLLAAESSEDRQTWLIKLARSIAPVPLGAAQQIRSMQRGGFANVQLSLNHEWTRYWIHLSQKTLYIFIKEIDKWEEIDLRKATQIKTCKVFPKNNSEVLRATFFIHLEFVNRCELNVQADALLMTSAWLGSLKTAMTESVSHLSSQALNADNVPLFIQKCAEFIVKNGIEVEGVYRRSGHNSNIAGLLKLLQTNGARVACDKLDDFQIHDVTNALKRYLRKLDDPLLMKAFYEKWITLSYETNQAEKVVGFRQLLAQLPIVNYCTLKYIIKHLLQVAEHEETNKMSISNLSMIFGAVLVSTEMETPSAADLSAANYEIAVVRFLLEYYTELFEYHDKYVEKEKMLVRRQTVSEDVLAAEQVSDDHIVLSFYIRNKERKKVTLKVLPCTKASEVLVNIIQQERLDEHQNWVLHEVICNDELERPIHYTETVVDVTMRWARWPEEFRRSNYLCLASAVIYRGIDAVFDPFTPLYCDLKLASKKAFKKYFFEFSQCTLSYRKDSKGENSSKLMSWKVSDITIYVGVQVKRNPPTRFGLTFITNSEPPVSPYFGRSICFAGDPELYSWLAALMLAQHPEGLSVPSSA